MGVKIQLKRSVQEVKSSHIVLNNGVIPAKNIIWAAGEILSPIITKHVQYFGIEENRVQVDDFLEAYEDIYVIGDCAKDRGKRFGNKISQCDIKRKNNRKQRNGQ